MKNEVLYVLLNEYADYEPAFISTSITCGRFGMRENPMYINKVVARFLLFSKSVSIIETELFFCVETHFFMTKMKTFYFF